MTIKDVEERTGLSRSNIRFYEKEKLIEPSRNESNGYRDYSENDVENIKKIAYLRTLGISIEDIRSIISEKVTLQEMLEKQKEVLKNQITDLNKAKLMCEKMAKKESNLASVLSDRKSTRLNSSHTTVSRMPSSA